MWCIVNLPNGTQQAVKWDIKATGQECFEQVCKALGICCEMEYFGLEPWYPNREESNTRQWINLRNRLSLENGNNNLMLALRVKFWVPVHHLLQDSVRNLFYMQAKIDLLQGRLMAPDWKTAAEIAALLCQADGICFNEQSLKAKCPLRLKKEQELLQQQQQQQTQQKERNNTLTFKKRRLSKQKSTENLHNSLQQQQSGSSNVTIETSSQQQNSSVKENNNQSDVIDYESENDSLLTIYEKYIVRTAVNGQQPPGDFMRQIAIGHGILSKLKMPQKTARDCLLKKIQDFPGYGEEVFIGVTTAENSQRCEVSVGAHGINVKTGDNSYNIPFSAIGRARSFRRIFKLIYVDECSQSKDLEIRFPKQALAAGLYRSITERHAFYVCDKVRGDVTNQYTRDFKGTIVSMFKEGTELGKRYVFDIQHTCREVLDQARRVLDKRGIETNARLIAADDETMEDGLLKRLNGRVDLSIENLSTIGERLDLAVREKEEREATIKHLVDTRIAEAMTCKICMDRPINTVFNPCGHMSCSQCAARCLNCPSCRIKFTNVVIIYLPTELRINREEANSDDKSNDTIALDDKENATTTPIEC